MSSYYKDPDPQETEDWLDSLVAVIAREGILVEDWNRMHPEQPGRKTYIEEIMSGFNGRWLFRPIMFRHMGSSCEGLCQNR